MGDAGSASTFPIPSHCASIVATSTLRVKTCCSAAIAHLALCGLAEQQTLVDSGVLRYFTDNWSQQGHSVSFMTTLFFFGNHKRRHQATSKLGCQPGDCKTATLIFFSGFCGYIWVDIMLHTHFITPVGTVDLGRSTSKCAKLNFSHLLSSARKAKFERLKSITNQLCGLNNGYFMTISMSTDIVMNWSVWGFNINS